MKKNTAPAPIRGTDGTAFTGIQHVDSHGVEFWIADDLRSILGWRPQREFEAAISKAMAACRNNGFKVTHHFYCDPGEKPGSIRLSRYACWLVASYGDPCDNGIAVAQTYYAGWCWELAYTLLRSAGMTPVKRAMMSYSETLSTSATMSDSEEK